MHGHSTARVAIAARPTVPLWFDMRVGGTYMVEATTSGHPRSTGFVSTAGSYLRAWAGASLAPGWLTKRRVGGTPGAIGGDGSGLCDAARLGGWATVMLEIWVGSRPQLWSPSAKGEGAVQPEGWSRLIAEKGENSIDDGFVLGRGKHRHLSSVLFLPTSKRSFPSDP